MSNRLVNAHFGWIESVEKSNRKAENILRIAYGGNFGWPQSPEILAKAVEGLDGVEPVLSENIRIINLYCDLQINLTFG